MPLSPKTLAAGLCAIALVALAGCSKDKPSDAMMEGGEQGQVDIDVDGSVRVETEDGTFESGSGEMPKNWPEDVPTYPGATVEYSAVVHPDEGSAGVALSLSTSDDPAEVAAYFKEELVEQGWTIEGTMEGQGNTLLGASKDTRQLAITITAANGRTMISVGMELQE